MRNKSLFFPLCFIFSACSSIKPLSQKNEKPIEKKLEVTSKKISVYTGKLIFEKVNLYLPDGVYDLKCLGQDIPMYIKSSQAQVYISANYFHAQAQGECSLVYNDKKYKIFDLEILKYDYPRERLYVDKKRVFYSKEDMKRIIEEKEITKKIYKQSAAFYYFDEPFSVPLESKITSYYGNRRLFNDKKESQHLGNDLRAAVGVDIPVSNKGKVVYTGDLFFSGNVVIVDHGLNIFTVYSHLSKILVQKGDMVLKGDIVGLAGMTGRVSGPHLHWGVKVNGSNVDGFSLVDESVKQFK